MIMLLPVPLLLPLTLHKTVIQTQSGPEVAVSGYHWQYYTVNEPFKLPVASDSNVNGCGLPAAMSGRMAGHY